MSLTEKTNHVEEAISNLIDFFEKKPKMVSTLTAFVNQVQDLEVAFFQLLNEVTLDSSVGVQLDGIGAIVGEEREGRNDDDYRIAIRVRILVNKASGTPEDILEIFATMITESFRLDEFFPAAITLTILEGITDALAFQINKKLQTAKQGGVRAHLVYGNGDAHDWFTFDTESWANSTAYVVGDIVINVTPSSSGVYICTTAGTSAPAPPGPTGTGTGIVDGSCVWDYIKPAREGKGWDLGKWMTAIE